MRLSVVNTDNVHRMGNIFYESLGRVTWAVGKRKVRQAITPSKSHKRAYLAISVVAIGAIATGAVLARTNAPRT